MQDSKELALPTSQPSTNQGGVVLTSLPMVQIGNIAKVMAASGMFPDIAKDGAKAFVKILAGQEMGIAPFEAMGGISIIQGKATVGGNIMAAKVKGSGKYNYKVLARSATGCKIEFFEKTGERETTKWESLGIEEFSEQDAQAAQLAGKDMWKKYPKNMYFNRCISNGVRTYCPDVLGAGPVYTPEEMGAPVDEEGNAIMDSGTTYKQDAPAEPAPAAIAETAQDAPQEELAPAAEARIHREGNPLQLISDDLELKGFSNKADRGLIALRFAEVDDFGELKRDEWFEVYDRIVDIEAEDLAELLALDQQSAAAAPADESAQEDIDNVTNVFGGEVEALPTSEPDKKTTPKKTATRTPTTRPKQSDLIRLEELYKFYGVTTDKKKEEFNQRVIGKNYPASSDDYSKLIKSLEDREQPGGS